MCNRLITAGIAVELVIILLIVYTPAGHLLFGTAPIGWSAWLVALPFATTMLVLEEVRKAFVRSSERRMLAHAEVQVRINSNA